MTKGFHDLLEEWGRNDPFYSEIFGEKAQRYVTASLRSRSSGWIAGVPFAQEAAQAFQVEARWKVLSGEPVEEGEAIAFFRGTAEQIVRFENIVIGLLAKPSGIASAARKARELAQDKIRLVAGGWKKHPFLVKDQVLEAVSAGGIARRILEEPFLYLDKNYVRILGGIGPALRAVASSPKAKVIQLRGESSPIAEEAREALTLGADVLMVDTGSWRDLEEVIAVMKEGDVLRRKRLAFAGGIRLNDIPALVEKGVDILDIGKAILDAPWLELTYDVVGSGKEAFE